VTSVAEIPNGSAGKKKAAFARAVVAVPMPGVGRAAAFTRGDLPEAPGGGWSFKS